MLNADQVGGTQHVVAIYPPGLHSSKVAEDHDSVLLRFKSKEEVSEPANHLLGPPANQILVPPAFVRKGALLQRFRMTWRCYYFHSHILHLHGRRRS